jgi:uncharacterized delta-60 repeat protein
MKQTTKNWLIVLVMAPWFAVQSLAQTTPSLIDGFQQGNFVVTGRVHTAVCDTNGNLMLGGAFRVEYGGMTYNRLFTRLDGGNLPLAQPTVSGNHINAIVPLPNGQVLVGGDCRGDGITNLILMEADCNVVTTFAPNPKGEVLALARQEDGKILVGGSFTGICGQARSFLARLNSDGTLDTSFTAQPNSNVTALAVQPDGKILVGGAFTSISGAGCQRLARLRANGALDPDFGGSADGLIRTLALYPDGRMLVGGDFDTISGVAKRGLAVLYANGQAWSEFPSFLDAGGSAYAVALQPDGQAIVGGTFAMLGGVHLRQRLARLKADGRVDTSFVAGVGATGTVHGVAVQPNGMIVAVGDFTSFNGAALRYAARVHENGLLDQTLAPNIVTTMGYGPMALALQTNGGIMCGGDMLSVDGEGAPYFGRLDARGRFDSSFVSAFPDDYVFTVANVPDGTMICGGMFTQFDSLPRRKIAELNPSGLVNQFFTNGVNGVAGHVYTLTTLTSLHVLVTGTFTNIGGATKSRIALFYSDGQALVSSFAATANGPIYSTAVRPDGGIVVAGTFTRLNLTERAGLGALRADGTLNPDFDPAPDAPVWSVLAQPDGKILVGGAFTNIGGGTSPKLARLRFNGTLDPTFTPPVITDGRVSSLALRADGEVIAAGSFTNVTGTTFRRFAQFSSNGVARSGYATYTRASNNVAGLAIQPDGKVIAVGDFLKVANQDRVHMVRFLSNSKAASRVLEADTNGTWVAWTLSGSCPQVWQARFESSSDGTNWTSLGVGVWTNGAWKLSGLSLPLYETFYIRARGLYTTGMFNGSQSIMQSVRQFYLTPRVVPTIAITTPSGAVTLPAGTTSYGVGGTQSGILGSMWWTLNDGLAHLFAAASPWSITVNGLTPGTNRVSVFGTSISGTLGQNSVDLIVQPAGVTGLSATDRTLRDRIRVSWTAAAGALAYEVWRNTSDSSASATRLGESASASFDDANVTPNRRYYYWVRARHAAGMSALSSSVSGRRGGPTMGYASGSASDLAVYNAAAGLWYVRTAGGEALAWAVAWGFATGTAVPGDYDGDGALDLAVFDNASGNWYIRTVAGAVLAWAEPWGWPGAVPVPGDFDGDGASDLAVFDGASGSWYIRTLSGSVLAWATPWGWYGAMPVAGDYDGDGASDLCVFDPARAIWYILALDGRLLGWELAWGGVGFDPVPGDYDGDRVFDLAVYYEVGGRWYIRSVAGVAILWDTPWGGPGMSAVSGDFDGDGIWDLAAYQEAGGRWYIRTVAGASILWDAAWGGPGMRPVGE